MENAFALTNDILEREFSLDVLIKKLIIHSNKKIRPILAHISAFT